MKLTTHVADGVPADEEAILRLHEALGVLEAAEPRLAKVVEIRYFGGYTQQEIGETLEVTDRTVRRNWENRRLLLEISSNGSRVCMGACDYVLRRRGCGE